MKKIILFGFLIFLISSLGCRSRHYDSNTQCIERIDAYFALDSLEMMAKYGKYASLTGGENNPIDADYVPLMIQLEDILVVLLFYRLDATGEVNGLIFTFDDSVGFKEEEIFFNKYLANCSDIRGRYEEDEKYRQKPISEMIGSYNITYGWDQSFRYIRIEKEKVS